MYMVYATITCMVYGLWFVRQWPNEIVVYVVEGPTVITNDQFPYPERPTTQISRGIYEFRLTTRIRQREYICIVI